VSARNTHTHYGWVAKAFHWCMALMILGLLGVGLYMSDMEVSPFKFQLYWWHKSLGITVLMLVVGRVLWRITNPSITEIETMPRWQRLAAKAVHVALYALMFSMPLSGWLMSSAYGFSVSFFGLFTMPDLIAPDKELAHFFNELHELGMIAFFACIGLHTAAALKHHVVDKDATLRRMLP
jgi:cytochrome b561